MELSDHQEYDDNLVSLLEMIWGEGYLSPGGPDEVAKLVEGVSLEGKRILDIGCGTGGIDQLLVEQHRAGHIVGIDVEASVITKAVSRAQRRELYDRLSFQHVEAGELPFEEASFDVVFSKDAIIHIADKQFIAQQAYRVLRPGGQFIASDWMKSEGPVSAELAHYIELEDLGFGMGSLTEYRTALVNAGFVDLHFNDRNAWYREVAKQEHATLSGSMYRRLVDKIGKTSADQGIAVWEAMLVVLDRGELRPTHWKATKPR